MLHYSNIGQFWVQHRFTRMIKLVYDTDYLNRLKELNLWTLEKRWNRVGRT